MIVILGSVFGCPDWAALIRVGLCWIVAAIALSIAGIARSREEAQEDVPAQRGTRRLWLILAAAILLHGVRRKCTAELCQGDAIDCYTFQRDALQGLVHGANPYGSTQADVYGPVKDLMFYGPGAVINGRVQEGDPYPPLTLYWALPGYLLGDVRYSYILAVMLAAVFSFAMVPSVRGLCFAVFLLANPITLYVESRCWTEPLVLLALSATLYAAVKKRRWLPVALGLFLASKQYNLLALPFFGYLVVPFRWRAWLKLTVQSLAVAAVTLLPFVCWNARGLWHDTVVFLLAVPPRNDALSFAVLFPFMLKAGPALLVAFLVWSARYSARGAGMFAAGYGVALLLFVATGKQAFCNYYFLIAQALLLAAAALPCSPLWPRMLTDTGDRM